MANIDDCRRVLNEPRDTTQSKAIAAWITSDLSHRYELALFEPLPPALLDLLSE